MGSDGEVIQVVVNGKSRQVPDGRTVFALLEDLGLDPGGVVVEHNRQILERASLAEVQLGAGDVLEIVHFVGGG